MSDSSIGSIFVRVEYEPWVLFTCRENNKKAKPHFLFCCKPQGYPVEEPRADQDQS